MILRKPYAFFIKYFKLINLIMAIFMAILIYRTGVIGKFLNDYVNDYTTVSSGFAIGNYINIYSFLMVLLIIIFTIIVLSVLFVKQKPKKLYIINLILYIAVIALYAIDYNVMRSINETILDIRISKALRDVTFIFVGLQAISFCFTLVRATGFDIKNFDFGTDLQQLEIDTKDNEEFEVDVEFDKNKLNRNVRKNLRNIKYTYFEHKFVINIVAIVTVVVIAFVILMNQGIYSANYKQGESFQASGIVANVKNSYLTQNDQNRNKVSDDNVLVVLRMDVKKLSADENKLLNTGLATLRVGDKSFGQTTEYNDYLTDMGTGYIDQKLATEFTSYLLTFEVPKGLSKHTMTLKFNDQISYVKGEMGAKSIYVKLKPIDLTKEEKNVESKFGETLDLSGSILGNSQFTINQFAIGSKFKVPYNFCYKKDNCTSSYEYVTPSATGNYYKTLVRIDGDFQADENMNLTTTTDIYSFLNTFGTINYLIGNHWYSHRISSTTIKPKMGVENNITYIEVKREVEQATSIYLTLNVRNHTYKYVLK